MSHKFNFRARGRTFVIRSRERIKITHILLLLTPITLTQKALACLCSPCDFLQGRKGGGGAKGESARKLCKMKRITLVRER